jgi:MFS family permease
MFAVFVIFFGIGYGLWGGVIAAFPADYFGLKATGSILGFVLISAGIGVAIGPYVGGLIFDRTHSYDYMVIMCIIAAIFATISALFIKPPVKRSVLERKANQ